jgi:hypothetical protein
MELTKAVAALQAFTTPDVTRAISRIERSIEGMAAENCNSLINNCGAGPELLAAAGMVKRIAGQINVVIHAIGILLCLPHLLQPGEIVDYVSLGAGNTGRSFDLETNHRIAEFKFIRWQGGAEAIRQNSLFKDFFLLAESAKPKQKFLYVLGTDYPLQFLNGRRSLESVLSKNVPLNSAFRSKYPHEQTVRDYYLPRKDMVKIEDVSQWLPDLVEDDMQAKGAAL